MKPSLSQRVADLAKALNDEGDSLAAATVCFVGSLHFRGDVEALTELKKLAMRLSNKANAESPRIREELSEIDKLWQDL